MGQVPGVLCRTKVNGVENPFVIPLMVHRTIGGRELDRATVKLDLDLLNQRIQSTALAVNSGDEIHIIANINGTDKVLFWGQTGIAAIDLGQTEQLSFAARVEPWHFGEPVGGMVQLNPVTGAEEILAEDIIFNPEIDGRIEGNALPSILGTAFYDPESARTAAARALLAGATPELWGLDGAAFYLFSKLNAAQTYINNPPLAGLAVLPNDKSLLKNFRIPIGMYLPEALDRLLEPFGFGWWLENVSETNRVIRFFQKGAGSDVTVYLGPIGSTIGPDNALENKLDVNIGSVRNKIQLLGSFREYESTWELYRAWPAALDAPTDDSIFSKDHADYGTNPTYQRAWRDWVLNEAGDYDGLRTEIVGFTDLSTLFGVKCFRTRRKFLPCLTQADDLSPAGEIAGCYVEFSTDGGTTWQVLDKEHFSAVHILDRECGIRFDGQEPPAQLKLAGSEAKVRITATIRSDTRVIGTSTSGVSPQVGVAGEEIDASGRFHYREVLDTSVFYVQVAAGSRTSTEVDDTAAIQTASDQLLSAWNMADISGQFLLSTLDEGGPSGYAYELGQIVKKIQGREVTLNASIASPTEPAKYPQIVGLTWDCQGQKRTLQVETFRQPASMVIG